MDTSRKITRLKDNHIPNDNTTNAHASAYVSWQLSTYRYSRIVVILRRNEAYKLCSINFANLGAKIRLSEQNTKKILSIFEREYLRAKVRDAENIPMHQKILYFMLR